MVAEPGKNPKTERRPLDRIDRRILQTLQEDGRLSNVELARRVGLSPTPCLERVRRLERGGYITGYRALLSPQKLDAALLAFVQVTLDRTTPDAFEQFRTTILSRSEILECHMVAGGFDYLLKVRVRDMAAYRHFLGETLTAIAAISQTHTYVVMEEVKSDGPLPVGDD